MQYLTTRMSRGRVLELILGARLLTAEEAAAYGWINRALPPHKLDTSVDDLARDIAALPEGVASAAKRVLPPTDLKPGFVREEEEWAKLIARPAAERLIRSGLERGAQTPAGEKDLEGLLRTLQKEHVSSQDRCSSF